MKQIEATILGQSYMLACPPDGEALLREAVAIVDREMSAIRDAGKVKARERIAVLTALNLAYQRAEQAQAAARAPAPVPQPALAVADGEIDVEHLIRRIDGVLGQDGQLL
ncbi:MAG: cell division protein ZapA [Burkholderiaceae bacterium]|nr:cell division protein ZapA [Burkholderiaceae bacterium]